MAPHHSRSACDKSKASGHTPVSPAMPDALMIRVTSPERGHEQLSSVFVETVTAIHCGHGNPTCLLLHWNWNVNGGREKLSKQM